MNSVNRAILRAVNSGGVKQGMVQHGKLPVGDAPPDTVGDQHGIETAPAAGDTIRGETNSATRTGSGSGEQGAGMTEPAGTPAVRVFLTSQEGVRMEGEAGGEDCVVLRYALAGQVSLSEAWPGVVEQTRRVMATELGHVHFCSCFS